MDLLFYVHMGLDALLIAVVIADICYNSALLKAQKREHRCSCRKEVNVFPIEYGKMSWEEFKNR